MRLISLVAANVVLCMSFVALAAEKDNTKPDGTKTAVEYRLKKAHIALEAAGNKGLSAQNVIPAKPLEFPRSTPLPQFVSTGRQPEKPGSIAAQKIEGHLTSGDGPTEFGFPFPKGALFDARHVRVLDAQGGEIPSQVSATSFWPDDSIKWVLLQFSTPADARFAVEFGNDVTRKDVTSPLRLERKGDTVTIRTGAIQAKINATKFNLLEEVTTADGKTRLGGFASEGVRLVGEDGKIYAMSALPPSRFDVEQEGPEKIVLRVAGDYADAEGVRFMSYVTRMAFRADSPRVEVSHRHINTVLEHEFTDFQSLEMPFDLEVKPAGARLLLPNGRETPEEQLLRVFQLEENVSKITEGPKTRSSGRSPGVMGIQAGTKSVTVACREFWQRWPKALGIDGHRVTFGLLPKQPDADYGQKLEPWLVYPFVNGNYRMKWGMAFTETVLFDFGGNVSLSGLAAAVNDPPIAILPSTWYAETGALGPMAPLNGGEFKEWDDFFERDYFYSLTRRERNREYGVMNYGDWWGERGRNWGNNEYDTAHKFFMQFARTGDPRYYKFAMAAARHQADVDIVHAYPDPAYVGANHQHSIGHTGVWDSNNKYSTWSHPYDTHTSAENGHTWSEGMTEAWFLAGDAGVMESALQLGEHITWSAAPVFKMAVTSPRTGGWSLRAIMGLYQATGDPEYLKAAGSIARSMVETQDQSGLWLRVTSKHLLPGSDKPEGDVSNFQLGIALAGLYQYYKATGDPKVREALMRGVKLFVKAWPGSGGWPYDFRPDGTPSQRRPTQMPAANVLDVEAVAAMGLEENDPEMLRVAEEALQNFLFYVEPTGPKSLALRSGQAVLGPLHEAYKRHGGQWPGISVNTQPDVFFKGIPNARKFNVRGPGTLTFLIRTKGEATPLKLFRRDAHDFDAKGIDGKIRVKMADGAVISEQKTILAGKVQEFPVEFPAGEDPVFLLEIEDPGRGTWDFEAEGLAGVLMKTSPGFIVSNVSVAKYSIEAPKGTESFSIALNGTHPGAYGAAVLDGNGKVLALYHNVNAASEVPEHPTGNKVINGMSPVGNLEVKLGPEDAGKPLTLVLWAGYDLIVDIQGIPPWIARNPEEYFTPSAIP